MNGFQTSAPELLGKVVEAQISGPYPQNFWFSRSEVGPKFGTSAEFPGNADASGLGTKSRKHCSESEIPGIGSGVRNF